MNENLNEQEKNERKVDNLINLVEKHTRTERHLEQYSDMGDPKYKEMAEEKQEVREEQIEELKEQLIGEEDEAPSKSEQLEDLKQNYEYAQGYIENNKEHMDEQDLVNLQQKQENRKIQIENLEDDL